jgi:hypothetical protein
MSTGRKKPRRRTPDKRPAQANGCAKRKGTRIRADSACGPGGDDLYSVMEDMTANWRRSYEREREIFQLYGEIHALYGTAEAISCSRKKERLLPRFLVRSHACFCGAFCLATGGLVPECFMLVRGCIENALYAHLISRCPELGDIWLHRHDGDAQRKHCKAEFTIGKAMGALGTAQPDLAVAVKGLYEQSIDLGAHPNPRGHMGTSSEDDWGSYTYLLHPSPRPLVEPVVRLPHEAGAQSLRVFGQVYGDRFQAISERLAAMCVS